MQFITCGSFNDAVSRQDLSYMTSHGRTISKLHTLVGSFCGPISRATPALASKRQRKTVNELYAQPNWRPRFASGPSNYEARVQLLDGVARWVSLLAVCKIRQTTVQQCAQSANLRDSLRNLEGGNGMWLTVRYRHHASKKRMNNLRESKNTFM